MKFFTVATVAVVLQMAISVANAQAEDSFLLLYHCDASNPERPRLLFGNAKLLGGRFPKRKKSNARYERINVAKLVIQSVGTNPQRPESVTREGSKEIERRCGAISMRIMGDYLNENPDGEAGASVFPYVRLLLDGVQVYSVAIGECRTPSDPYDRYHVWRDLSCPNGWATSVSATRFEPTWEADENDKHRLDLLVDRKYEEFLTVPQPIIPPDAAR